MRRQAQAGATMVEFSIGCILFLVMTFIIIDICLSYWAWNQVSEAARDGERYLIVNDPVASISGQSCPGGGAVVQSCGTSCSGLMTVIHNHAAFVSGSNVSVQYACSASGNPGRPGNTQVRDVAVTISGVKNPFVLWVVPAEGLSTKQLLPTVTVARDGESMDTLVTPP